MKVAGLDICRGSAVVCCLDFLPDNPKHHFRHHRKSIRKYFNDRNGIEEFLKIQPDLVIMEPTGVHYAKFWADVCRQHDIVILWVGHSQLRSHRLDLGLPSKNDPADALALCCYAHRHLKNPSKFIRFDIYSDAVKIRLHSLELIHLAKLKTRMVNRIKQNLCHEWPEASERKVKRISCHEKIPGLWGFIAGRKIAKNSTTRFNNQIRASVGSGLSEYTQDHAEAICQIEEREIKIERKLLKLLSLPEFRIYNEVLEPFRMGRRIRAMVISHIYPIESYLNEDKRPIKDWVESQSGKRPYVPHNVSLGAFKLSLGLGLTEYSSGDGVKWGKGGARLPRTSLWQWVLTTVERKAMRTSPELIELGEYCDKLKGNKIGIDKVRMKVAAKASKMIFRSLVKKLQSEHL